MLHFVIHNIPFLGEGPTGPPSKFFYTLERASKLGLTISGGLYFDPDSDSVHAEQVIAALKAHGAYVVVGSQDASQSDPPGRIEFSLSGVFQVQLVNPFPDGPPREPAEILTLVKGDFRSQPDVELSDDHNLFLQVEGRYLSLAYIDISKSEDQGPDNINETTVFGEHSQFLFSTEQSDRPILSFGLDGVYRLNVGFSTPDESSALEGKISGQLRIFIGVAVGGGWSGSGGGPGGPGANDPDSGLGSKFTGELNLFNEMILTGDHQATDTDAAGSDTDRFEMEPAGYAENGERSTEDFVLRETESGVIRQVE